MKNYKELIIWQRGIDIVKKVYALTKHFPKEEKYGIVSQLTRAGVSIPANLAEGSSKNSDKDYARFLLIIAKEMNWAHIEDITELEIIIEEEIKMLHRFINTLNKANS